MIDTLRKKFDSSLEAIYKSRPEVLKFILKHERKEICIKNLYVEIMHAEGLNLIPNLDVYDTLIKDVAKLFARTCLEHKEQELLSAAERKRREQNAEQNRLREAGELMKDLEKEAFKHGDDEVRHAIKEKRARSTDEVSDGIL